MLKNLLLFLFIQQKLSVKPIHLTLTNSDQNVLQSITMNWDFNFNRICVAQEQVDCNKVFCQLIKEDFKSNYHNIEYVANVYLVNIIAKNENQENFMLQIELDFIKQGDCLALGLGPDSSLKNALKDKILKIDPFSSQLVLVDQKPDITYSLDTIDDTGFESQKRFVMNSQLSYKLSLDIISINETVDNSVVFCLNPRSYHNNRSYFFQVAGNFAEDWEIFRQKLDGILIQMYLNDVSYSLKNDEQGYVIPYDMDLFKAYDGYPMKNMTVQLVKGCEGFLGDFFYERSGINFYLTSDNGDNLQASFEINVQPYRFLSYRIYKTLLLVIWFSLLFYLIYVAVQSKIKREEEMNNTSEYLV